MPERMLGNKIQSIQVKDQPGRVIADLVNMDPDAFTKTTIQLLETYQLPIGIETMFKWDDYNPSQGPKRLEILHNIRYRLGEMIPDSPAVEAPLPMKRGLTPQYNYTNPQPFYWTPTMEYRYIYLNNAFEQQIEISKFDREAHPNLLGNALNKTREQKQQIKRAFIYYLMQNSPLADGYTETLDYDTTTRGDAAIDLMLTITNTFGRFWEKQGLPTLSSVILCRTDFINWLVANFSANKDAASTFERLIQTNLLMRTFSMNGFTFVAVPESSPYVLPTSEAVDFSPFEKDTNFLMWDRKNTSEVIWLNWYEYAPLAGGPLPRGLGQYNIYVVENLAYFGGEIVDSRRIHLYKTSTERDKGTYTYPSDLGFNLTSMTDHKVEPSDTKEVPPVVVPELSTIITTTALGELADGQSATILAAVKTANPNATGGYTIQDITDTTANAVGDGTTYTGTVALTFTIKAAAKFVELEKQVEELKSIEKEKTNLEKQVAEMTKQIEKLSKSGK